jgi:hypothetical protein
MKEPAVTDSAAAFAPPGVRRTGAPSRPADPRTRLHVVPEPATLQSETATSTCTPTEHVSAAQIVSDSANPDAGPLQIAGWRGLYERTRGYWTPPAIFTQTPATLAELAEYARYAPWTQQSSGIFRAAGIGYYRLVAYPATVGHRYGEWVAQRPGRLLIHMAGIKLAAMTGPGIWLVDHLIYPAARIVGQILL